MDQHATSSVELYINGAIGSDDPFPHVAFAAMLSPASASRALAWLQTGAPWRIHVGSFYEQHEFSLLSEDTSDIGRDLVSAHLVDGVREVIREHFTVKGPLALVDVTAHKLTVGQTIRIHNDSIHGEETHRVLIQLNNGWSINHGGLLMLFRSNAPEDVHAVIEPVHGSGFAFEISDRSFHAVSTVKMSERFTLVYTFRDRR